ncbi:MAG: hypothetical protein K1X94_18455 [Sandaracinaceae bacterium]|nr:hypothetical protein [Sandaracinaceae bacterium]
MSHDPTDEPKDSPPASVATASAEEASSGPTALAKEPPRALARPSTAGAAVYAAAAGVVSAVPVPFVDGILGGIARGSAMRRVASRRGVRLSREARKVLSQVSLSRSTGTGPARFLRAALSRALAPVRIASRLEEAGATFLAALVFDHYLQTSSRRVGSPVGEAEALRVRAAMEQAFVDGGLEALRAVPMGALETVFHAGRDSLQPDLEDRGLVERFVDHLLDGAADAPSDVFQRVCDLFDAALVKQEGSR